MRVSRGPESAQAAPGLLRLGGYQGEASILTAGLRRLMQGLQQQIPDWPLELEANVPAAGESAQSLFASVEQGQRQLCYMASGYLSARVPELDVLDLPFAVTDRQAAWAALDGEAGRLLSEAVSRRTGYQVLGYWDNGVRHLSNSVRPIREPRDCEGLVIRTLDSATYRATLDALGFTARTTDVKELVRVVASGEVQAQENPLTNLLNFELWRYHPYVSLSGHFHGVLLLLCPRDWFEALSQARRAALQDAMVMATRQQRIDAVDEDRRALAELAKHGVQVLPPEALDLEAMRTATAGVARVRRDALPTELLRAYLSGQ